MHHIHAWHLWRSRASMRGLGTKPVSFTIPLPLNTEQTLQPMTQTTYKRKPWACDFRGSRVHDDWVKMW